MLEISLQTENHRQGILILLYRIKSDGCSFFRPAVGVIPAFHYLIYNTLPSGITFGGFLWSLDDGNWAGCEASIAVGRRCGWAKLGLVEHDEIGREIRKIRIHRRGSCRPRLAVLVVVLQILKFSLKKPN